MPKPVPPMRRVSLCYRMPFRSQVSVRRSVRSEGGPRVPGLPIAGDARSVIRPTRAPQVRTQWFHDGSLGALNGMIPVQQRERATVTAVGPERLLGCN